MIPVLSRGPAENGHLILSKRSFRRSSVLLHLPPLCARQSMRHPSYLCVWLTTLNLQTNTSTQGNTQIQPYVQCGGLGAGCSGTQCAVRLHHLPTPMGFVHCKMHTQTTLQMLEAGHCIALVSSPWHSSLPLQDATFPGISCAPNQFGIAFGCSRINAYYWQVSHKSGCCTSSLTLAATVPGSRLQGQ